MNENMNEPINNNNEGGCGCGCLVWILLFFAFAGAFLWMKGINPTDFLDITNLIPQKETKVMSTEHSQTVKQGNVEQPKYYYYNLLDSDGKQYYEQLYSGLTDLKSKIKVTTSDQDEIENIFASVLYDHPEIFWCKGSYEVSYSEFLHVSYLKADYIYDEETVDAKKEKIDAVTKKLLADAPSDGSDYQKILYVYRYIINHTDYETDSVNDQNMDSVLLNGKSVCGGYAKATQYLLQQMDIFCTYVAGTAGDSNENHAWNLVVCGGNYYYVDTTWGDPVFAATEGEDESRSITYDYFLCNDDMLLRTHNPDAAYNYPNCTSLDWNYYVVNGRYFTEYDSSDAWVIIKNDIDSKAKNSTFKFASHSAYEDAHDDLVENLTQQGMKRIRWKYGSSDVSCEYLDDEENCKIVIYWQY